MKIILFILFISSALSTMACRCHEISSIEKSYSKTAVVGSGKVLSLEYVSIWSTMAPEKRTEAKEAFLEVHPHTESLETGIIQKVSLEFLKNYKEEKLTDTIVIYTPRGSASCGFTSFKIGENFIVYANLHFSYGLFNPNKIKGIQQSNTYWTTHCTRTNYYHKEEANTLELLSQG